MKESGATITMHDMVEYYDRILENGKDLTESTRQYVVGLRDQTAQGILAIPDRNITGSTDTSHEGTSK
jgi:hypothetical protein